MNTAWTVEFTRIVTLVGLVLIAGFFSKQWLPVVFIASVVQHIHRSQKKNSHHKNRLNGLVKRFEATIAALPDATLVLNANLEIEWANRVACCRIYLAKKDKRYPIELKWSRRLIQTKP